MNKFIYVLIGLVVTGCGDDMEVPNQTPPPIEPEMQELYDEFGIVPEYNPDARRRKDYAPGEKPGEEPDQQDFEEKAVINAVTGWSLRSVLAFQDGQPQTVNGKVYNDFCNTTQFGVCDNEWHAQAANLDFGHSDIYNADLTGLCGVGSIRHWRACMLPKITKAQGGHTLTWRLNGATCSNTFRPRVETGIARAHALLGVAGLTFSQVTTPANIEYKCQEMGDDALGLWSPSGVMTARWGTFAHDVNETCTQSGYGTDHYLQRHDLFYTHDSSIIRIDQDTVIKSSADCHHSTRQFENSIANIITHEIGHLLGFTHQIYNDPHFGVMHYETECVNDGELMGFHPFMNDAVKAMDVRIGTGLTVLGQQLSCLGPLH